MSDEPSSAGPIARRAIRIRGIVQGVGFRPFVYRLACRHGLAGLVKNDRDGVLVEVEGEGSAIESFEAALVREVPPLARIAEIRFEPSSLRGETGFRIETSDLRGEATPFIAPDVATCEECVRELFDPSDRRFRYPFINCTNCGPRLTIVTGAPYDRARTTMASFSMCSLCLREYEDPRDRRFHAQPNACAACGPRLEVRTTGGGTGCAATDPLDAAVAALRAGKIVAVKGLGGFHLACDARSEEAVARLRTRKQRDAKPFAILVADAEAAASLAETSPERLVLLESAARPIVLLRRSPSADVAESVAPGSALLGVMLPYTPLHHLLVRAMGSPLVLTSGNRSGEPIVCEEADALASLGQVADLFLVHDRPIRSRCDDSVVRFDRGTAVSFRRSRGFAPLPVTLPLSLARPTLALGGHLKATFALGARKDAFVSHHLGDLDAYEAQRAYEEAIAHWKDLFHVMPDRILHDLHPDYASSCFARERGGSAELLAVQHHHAHMASCMAENGLVEDAIGVVWDGAGLGHDGALWGGEFLVGGYARVSRAAHWAYVPLPGGEQATREPWRMALSHLRNAGLQVSCLAPRIDALRLELVAMLCERRIQSPRTSSVGRLFDAVGSLVAGRDRVSFEGEAAIRLEALAAGELADGVYPFELGGGEPIVIDPRPLVRAVVEDLEGGVPPARIARRFHSTLADVIAAVCERLREAHGLHVVVLSGGVFMNAILTEEASARLEGRGFVVVKHKEFPPNDGGLSLGQLAVAAGLDATGRS
jgi:hydrogenase maturation protein HypF